MKVLIIGSGGREHAIAAAFKRSSYNPEVIVAPGNAGIAKEFDTLPLLDPDQVVDHCRTQHPDLVFIGPEQPLEQGLADRLREIGIPCVGPSQAAARIETSKIFAKQLMQKYVIPTASFFHSYSIEEALAYLENGCPFPAVIKADGLAAGKGVIIAHDIDEARAALSTLGLGNSRSPNSVSSGATKTESINGVGDLQVPKSQSHPNHKGVVIEEYLRGWEVSLFAITDSQNYVSTLFSQDHKQLLDGDLGPNTGGMGAYAPVPEAEPYRHEIETRIIGPTLAALRAEGSAFEGILYCGLMITAEGPKVIEFNCRLGDPETQALLPLLNTDLVDICQAINHRQVKDLKLSWSDGYCVAVVMASGGYPGSFTKGFEIRMPDQPHGVVYYSGVSEVQGKLVNSGGRVLCVSATAEDKAFARNLAYEDIKMINFQNAHFRTDIGLRKNEI